MSVSFISLFFFALVLNLVRQASCECVWFEPPAADGDLYRTYSIGETVFLSWNVSYSPIILRITHWDINVTITIGVLIQDETNQQAFSWTIGKNDGVTLAEIQDPELALRITDPSDTNSECPSPGFLVISKTQNNATNTQTTPSTTQINTSTSQTTSTILTSPTSVTSASKSNATSIGVEVGVPLGILLLAALALLFIRERMYRAKTEQLMRGGQPNIGVPPSEQVKTYAVVPELPSMN